MEELLNFSANAPEAAAVAAIRSKRPPKLGANVKSDVDWSRWVCVYPQYLDAAKSSSEGRRVPRDVAVKNPSLTDMEQACLGLGLPYVVEYSKAYPRDWMNAGRIRVKLTETTKKKFLVQLSSRLPADSKSTSSQSATTEARPTRTRKSRK